MRKHRIALIPGDGIGPEVIAEGVKVIEAAGEVHNFEVEYITYDIGADRYLATGELMTEETLKEIGERCEAIYLGAVGDPRVKPGILEKEILLKTRFYFDQYVNLRPIKLLKGVWSPLKDKGPADIDFTVVRENTEDFYVGLGKRTKEGKSHHHLELLRSLYKLRLGVDVELDGSDIAYQIGITSKRGAERIIRYAFELAKKEKAEVVHVVDKANVLTEMYGLWREMVAEVGASYPEIKCEFIYVDAMAMWLVREPERFKVVLTPNMFGDIITDLGAMLQGGLGLAPGGNINPDGVSMFEPIHGSAPELKGTNTANPLATIWAGALMLAEIGEEKSKNLIVKAIERVIEEGKVRTRDMGGSNTTSEVGDAVADKVRELGEM